VYTDDINERGIYNFEVDYSFDLPFQPEVILLSNVLSFTVEVIDC